jgi:tetratricopeptide (TPR) repeat protein
MIPMLDEPTLAGWMEQARSFVNEGKILHAIQMYSKVIDGSPRTAEAWIELFRVYCSQGKFEAAEHTLTEALERVDDPNEIRFLLGVLHLQTGDRLRAVSCFRKIEDSEESLPSEFRARVHFNLGLVYVQMHRWGLAEHHLRRTRQLNPEFPKINESLSEILLRKGRIQEVTQILGPALAKDPYSWMGHFLMGLALMRMQRWKDAYEQFVTAVDVDPKESRAWQKCGQCLIAMRELDQAEHYLKKALELNPLSTEVVVNFGFLYLERGDRSRASELFDRVLDSEPTNAAAREGKQILLRSAEHKMK